MKSERVIRPSSTKCINNDDYKFCSVINKKKKIKWGANFGQANKWYAVRGHLTLFFKRIQIIIIFYPLQKQKIVYNFTRSACVA